MTILDYGATVQSLLVPDRDGGLTDVVLGYDTIAEYERHDGYLGATIGRVANRIGQGRFTLNGKTYRLEKNDGENHLHGGFRGFDKRLWHVAAGKVSLLCTRLSPDGEEGYPGNLRIKVTFQLTDAPALKIFYDAETDRDTLANPTNHSYWNLSGGGTVLDHRLQVSAARILENDGGCLPTGRIFEAAGTPFDFRAAKPIGKEIGAENEQLFRGGGYDHNFILSGPKAAVLSSGGSGICMTVSTSLPGMQVYTANSLTPRAGKHGAALGPRGAVCLETQVFPDAVHHDGFPSPVLRAGQRLHTETVYAFSLL